MTYRDVLRCELARRDFWEYCKLLAPDFYKEDRKFLKDKCREYQSFYESQDEYLIDNEPPRHGKSRTATLFVQWVIGKCPKDKIITGSYNETLSTVFSKGVRNKIQETSADGRIVYNDIFPHVKVKRGDAAANLWGIEGNDTNTYLATSPTGTATGFGADLMLIDDIIKNEYEARNDNIKEQHWKWFTGTMLSRREGKRKVIVVMTRWASDDLAGRLIEALDRQGKKYRLICYKAFDGRSMLCEDILSRAQYEDILQGDTGKDIVEANYNQSPIDITGRLYSQLQTYDELPKNIESIDSYTDTADEGADFLCSIIYAVKDCKAYVLEVIYTQEGMEVTEDLVAKAHTDYSVNRAKIESNNGGKGFARNVKRIAQEKYGNNITHFFTFTQTKNKNSRILTGSTGVMNNVLFPVGWENRWREYWRDMTRYQRIGKNAHDDAQDATTGVYENLPKKKATSNYTPIFMYWGVVKIYTYNDLTDIGQNEQKRMEFVLDAIREHKGSDLYKTAYDAELYYKHQNPTIMRFQKWVYNMYGQKVPDIWSPNNKIASNWYNYFTTQAVSYLLGNGVTFKNESNKEKLGKDFDKKVQDVAIHAKNGGVAFGFWNLDHLECFDLTEFVPIYDEEDGGLKAGIRFWQIDDSKPLRATLYELDGYTDYIKRKGEDVAILHDKRAYTQIVRKNDIEGETILDGAPPAGFPIVPLWNINSQSDLVGNRGTIDAYDLMVSGLINNVSDGEFIYWILKNCGGMNEADDAKFIEQLKLTRVAHADGDDGASVEAHNVNVEFQATAEALDRLTNQLYADFMALKVQDLSAGNKTATEISAAYEPINQKTDQFEYQVTEFINGILALAGIEDEPTYTRSQMSNQSEMLEMVLQAAEYLDDEYVTTKILTLLGDADKAQEVLKRKDAEAADRYKQMEAELEDLKNQQEVNDDADAE